MGVLDALNVITISALGINMLDAVLVVIPPLAGIFAGLLIYLHTERYRRARRKEREGYHRSGIPA